MRDNPVTAITIFFPTDEVKNSDHFISQNVAKKNFCKNSIGMPNEREKFLIVELSFAGANQIPGDEV